MKILPVHTGHLHEGDDLASVICSSSTLQSGDIVCVSSKVVAITEGAAIKLESIDVSEEAKQMATALDRDAAFCQAVLNETARMNGKIISNDRRAILTELQPDGFAEGSLMAASAGLDRSNIEQGFTVGWPHDPVTSTSRIRLTLEEKSVSPLGIILSDSCIRPRRLGVVAQALVVCGFDPIVSQIDEPDLHGTPLKVTYEAVADQLATAANFVMGNANQAIPAAVVRGHSIPFSDFEGWVPGIDIKEDLFHGLL